MTMMKTLPLQESKVTILLWQECLYPPLLTVMTNNDDDLDAASDHNSVNPMRPTKIQAKHPYTAPEVTYQFTV